MTINIISTQINRTRITGPKKVLDNTLKGLEKIGITYVVNQPMYLYKYNWIHDDQKAIIEAGFTQQAVLIGPNTAVLPKDLPKLRKKLSSESIYLHPSPWAMNVWKFLQYTETRLDFWPAGIDTQTFQTKDRKNADKILVYFKERDIGILEQTKKVLDSLRLSYTIIHYGFYEEYDYIQALNECRFGIWIGRQESQGIGLQEALAANLPLIVLDACSLFDTVSLDSKNFAQYPFPSELKHIKTTSAPYFDDRCGLIINTTDELANAITYVEKNFDRMKPREFIEEHLSLEKSAQRLVSFFEEMRIEENTGYNHKRLSLFLFYAGLVFQKWAWRWVWRKCFK